MLFFKLRDGMERNDITIFGHVLVFVVNTPYHYLCSYCSCISWRTGVLLVSIYLSIFLVINSLQYCLPHHLDNVTINIIIHCNSKLSSQYPSLITPLLKLPLHTPTFFPSNLHRSRPPEDNNSDLRNGSRGGGGCTDTSTL
jgi:hypothetical protein